MMRSCFYPFFVCCWALFLFSDINIRATQASGAIWDSPEEREAWYEGQIAAWPLLEPDYEATGFRPEDFRRPIPEPYSHPRVFITAEELPAWRERLRTTESGQAILKGLCVSIAPLEDNERIRKIYEGLKKGSTDPVFEKLYREQGGSMRSLLMWKSFSILVDDDAEEARRHIPAVINHTRRFQKKFDQIDLTRMPMYEHLAGLPPGIKKHIPGEKDYQGYWEDIAHGTPAMSYDFLYNYMTEDERAIMRKFIADTTGGIWTHAMGQRNDGGNWAVCHWAGPIQHLAIEGEEGYDPEVTRSWIDGVAASMSYDRALNGASYEPLGKGALGFHVLPLLARRGVDIAAYSNVLETGRSFMFHSKQPFANKFKTGGGLGRALGNIVPWETVYLKYLYPDDPHIDYLYRVVVGDDYSPFRERWSSHFAAIMTPIFAAVNFTEIDSESDPTLLIFADDAELSFFDPESALLITRSDWTPDALWLHMRVNTAMSKGHLANESSGITFSAQGRVWGDYHGANLSGPLGSWDEARFFSTLNIDRVGASGMPAAFIEYEDTPLATFAAVDMKFAWDYKGGWRKEADSIERSDSFADSMPLVSKPRAPGYEMPITELQDWRYPGDKAGDKSRYMRSHVPVEYVFRSSGLIRGANPYLLIIDDAKKDNKSHLYEWFLQIPLDIELEESGRDWAILKEREGDRRLLVQTFRPQANVSPELPSVDLLGGYGIHERKNARLHCNRLRIPFEGDTLNAYTVIYPYRVSDGLPDVKWDSANSALLVEQGEKNDIIHFARQNDGRTAIRVLREGEPLFEFGDFSDSVLVLMGDASEKAGMHTAFNDVAMKKAEPINWNTEVLSVLSMPMSFDFDPDWRAGELDLTGKAIRVDGEWVEGVKPNVIEGVNSALASFIQTDFEGDTFSGRSINWTRTEGVIRGKHPYVIVLDDLKTKETSAFDWSWSVPENASIQTWAFKNQTGYPYVADTRLVERLPDNNNRPQYAKDSGLLVRALQMQEGPGKFHKRFRYEPALNWPGYLSQFGDTEHWFMVPGRDQQPDFKLLFFPYGSRTEMPQTIWHEDGSRLEVRWRDQVDFFSFGHDEIGRTTFVLKRERGEYRDQVLAFGVDYEEPVQVVEGGQIIGHWSFDSVRDNLVQDMSGRGNHGKLFGGAHVTPGINGLGLDPVSVPDMLPGEVFTVMDHREPQPPVTFGYMELPGSVLNPVDSRMTLSMWYSAPPDTGKGVAPYAFLEGPRRTGINSLFTIGGSEMNNNLDVRMHNHFTGDAICMNVVNNYRLLEMLGVKIPDPGKWHHLTLTFDQNLVKLYVDGQLIREVEMKGTLADLDKGDAIHVLDGLWSRIDELRIHDYPLSSREIQAMFEADGLGRKAHFHASEKNAASLTNIQSTDEKWAHVSDENGIGARMKNVTSVASDGKSRPWQFGPDSQMQIPHTLFQGKPHTGFSLVLSIKFPPGSLKGRLPIFSTNVHARNAVSLSVWDNSFWLRSTGATLRTDNNLEEDRWYQIAVVNDGYDLKLYQDGALIKEVPSYHEEYGLEFYEVITFGQNLNNSKEPSFTGEIENILMYNYSLSEDQVRALSNGRSVDRPELSMNSDGGQRYVVRSTSRR
ncbi:LamG-like jellyroll fold domain-containing protein [Rubellicoccus peritrichatus]|uniref:LamG-like jellyroll fold domain-containing protein n=1 Tax=Rubellicoccus peritrichatus TaxID=3080537 RepID=A0AAQ3QUT2_9BACT|nr:LamG-like jellyroll fold domain-containing protein [Puniceicoccus sp. CR14]WOO40728.1 LamG-like jellyroll fold domain-containing protein [Puniceicoccus sp. CR14]